MHLYAHGCVLCCDVVALIPSTLSSAETQNCCFDYDNPIFSRSRGGKRHMQMPALRHYPIGRDGILLFGKFLSCSPHFLEMGEGTRRSADMELVCRQYLYELTATNILPITTPFALAPNSERTEIRYVQEYWYCLFHGRGKLWQLLARRGRFLQHS